MPRKAIVLDYTTNDKSLKGMVIEVANKLPQALIYIYFGGDILWKFDNIYQATTILNNNKRSDQNYESLRKNLTANHAMEDLIFITAQDSEAEIKNVFPESLVLTPDDTVDTAFMKNYSLCML